MEPLFLDNWQTLLRTLIVGVSAYVSLVLLLRISGRRTLSKMNAFDMVVTVALGSTLATILLNRDVALAYVEAFCWTMRTEWGGIDKHRMDKYALLARRVTHHALRYAGERGWDTAERLAAALGEGVFGDSRRGIGYKLHVAGSFLRELEAVCAGESGLELDEGEEAVEAGSPTPISSEDLSTLVGVFVDAMQFEESSILQKRIREEVFEPLCDPTRAFEQPGAPRLTPSAMKSLCDRAIALGAQNGVDDVCRESLYELHAMLKKGANKIVKESEARGADPEAENVAPRASTKNGVSKQTRAEENGTAAATEKKKKKKNKDKKPASEAADDDEAARKEKKRRKRERRLAKEMAALAAEQQEAEEKQSAKKKAKVSEEPADGRKVTNGSKLVAMRALDRGNTASPTPSLDSIDSGSMSPRSKRLMWNDEGVTYSFPDSRSPINTTRGKRNLRLEPTKTIFRPIHGKSHKAPNSAPAKTAASKLSAASATARRSAESFF